MMAFADTLANSKIPLRIHLGLYADLPNSASGM